MKRHKHWSEWIQECKSIAEAKKISNVKISEATGIKPPHITRFFKAIHDPKLGTFAKIWNYVNNY
jgi:predicted transcriptional regulator